LTPEYQLFGLKNWIRTWRILFHIWSNLQYICNICRSDGVLPMELTIYRNATEFYHPGRPHVAQWSSHVPEEQKIRGSNPARVKGF
jgi:hypothetical protein